MYQGVVRNMHLPGCSRRYDRGRTFYIKRLHCELSKRIPSKETKRDGIGNTERLGLLLYAIWKVLSPSRLVCLY